MRRGSKIKRYGNIYGSRGGNAGALLMIPAMLAGVLLFGLVGWFIYPPVYQLVMGEKADQPPPALPSVSVSQAPAPDDSPSAPAASQPAVPTPAAPIALAGLYAPTASVNDAAALDSLLNQAVSAGYNAVLIDAKDAVGTVLFDTKNEDAAAAGAKAAAVYDAAEVAARIAAKGLEPVARLHAFRDSTAANLLRSMAVRYFDTEIIWLDNSPELGGKPWLNPYSKEARDYITALAVELADSGFSTIVVDSVQFPVGVGLDKAGYGAAGQGRSEQLSAFIDELSAAVEARGATAVFCLSPEAVQAEAQALSPYGAQPRLLLRERTALNLLSSPDAAPVTALRPDAQWMALLAAYEADGAAVSAAELAERARQQGFVDYLLIHPQDNYLLN